MNCRVILVDADPHGANLHTFFGLEDPHVSLGDVLLGQQSAQSSILPTGIPQLGLLSGLYQDLRITPDAADAVSFAHALAELDAQIVLWDVGSGVHPWSTRLFSLAEQGLLVIQPSFQAVEREYLFLRKLCAWHVANSISSPIALQNWLPVSWLAQVKNKDKQLAISLRQALQKQPLFCLVNGVRQATEAHLDQEIAAVSERFFSLRTSALGALPYDERLLVPQHLRRPLVELYPDAPWVEMLRQIALVLHQRLLVSSKTPPQQKDRP
jgi:MinD-like ATPase involved in chromosome partitioning or flagellar assembly